MKTRPKKQNQPPVLPNTGKPPRQRFINVCLHMTRNSNSFRIEGKKYQTQAKRPQETRSQTPDFLLLIRPSEVATFPIIFSRRVMWENFKIHRAGSID
jgi:hypothetical protein